MNNCSQAPQTDATRAAADAYLESWARDGMDWDAWMAEVERARQSFARLINADVDEVAVTSSVSQAASAFASALRFDGDASTRRRERSGVPDGRSRVARTGTARRRGAAGCRCRTTGRSTRANTRRASTNALASSRRVTRYFVNGFKQDIAAIARLAHARGALLFVDAYQTLGTEPIDVKALGVDALAGGTLKYLMACAGIAFLYVRRELAEQLRPTVTGWFGRVNPFAFDATTLDWAPGARRFDSGTPPIINAYIARAGTRDHSRGRARRTSRRGRACCRSDW